jgi:hypothetical protein
VDDRGGPGIVHQHIDPSPPVNRLVDDGRGRAVGANVGNERRDRGMCTGGLVQVGLAAPDAENVRSGLGEGNRGSTADPGSRILLR